MFVEGYGHWFSNHVSDNALLYLTKLSLNSNRADRFHVFVPQGGTQVYVDPTVHCFINHGCNGSNNVGYDLGITEASVDPEIIPDVLLARDAAKEVVYNPASERQVHMFSSAMPLRALSAEEELFDNYLATIGRSQPGWREDIESLKKQCDGSGVGVVREFDTWDETQEKEPSEMAE